MSLFDRAEAFGPGYHYGVESRLAWRIAAPRCRPADEGVLGRLTG